MGYRVEYGTVKKVRGLEKRVSRLPALCGAWLLVFFFLVTALWPEGRDLLRSALIPGDPAVTAAAFEDMTWELRQGEEISGALRTFCRQVLQGAGFAVG